MELSEGSHQYKVCTLYHMACQVNFSNISITYPNFPIAIANKMNTSISPKRVHSSIQPCLHILFVFFTLSKWVAGCKVNYFNKQASEYAVSGRCIIFSSYGINTY